MTQNEANETLPVGTKVEMCGRLGVIEKHLTKGGKLWRYYVRLLKSDGTPSERGTRCHPNNPKAII